MKERENKQVRCAIYTRKSTERGLDQAFNSLDAQRESGEAYVKSQQNEGWVCLPERYDDGGFSGGHTDRPAFKKLMRDIQARKIDVVIVYKVDRLSRSLLDFARIIGTFDEHDASLVSVTQQMDTGSSMGRLTLHILLSFAEFERQIISERTRDKMSAARRKGKWCGGQVPLGYELDPDGGRILVNAAEAETVRLIFDTYLTKESLIDTARELNSRGFRTKLRTARDGSPRGGHEWTKTRLSYLLRSAVYAGKVFYQDTFYDGEHEAIVDDSVWQRTQKLLKRNRRSGGRASRNKHGALLRGLLRCRPCNAAMGHVYTKKGSRIYRYYSCARAQKLGAEVCQTGPIPAQEIENFVVDRIRSIGTDPKVQAEVLAQLGTEHDHALVVEALERFELSWEQLSPTSQTRMINLLVERIGYNAEKGTIAITFRPSGIVSLSEKGAA